MLPRAHRGLVVKAFNSSQGWNTIRPEVEAKRKENNKTHTNGILHGIVLEKSCFCAFSSQEGMTPQNCITGTIPPMFLCLFVLFSLTIV